MRQLLTGIAQSGSHLTRTREDKCCALSCQTHKFKQKHNYLARKQVMNCDKADELWQERVGVDGVCKSLVKVIMAANDRSAQQKARPQAALAVSRAHWRCCQVLHLKPGGILAEKECLTYANDFIPITNSREAHNGEVPWVVSIDIRRYLSNPWEEV